MKTKLRDYIDSNGLPTDKNFIGDPEAIVAAMLGRCGAVKDIAAGMTVGMNSATGPHTGDAALQTVAIVEPTVALERTADLCASAASFALDVFGVAREDLLSIAGDLRAIAAAGGLDRWAEAEAGRAVKVKAGREASDTTGDIITAIINSDIDGLRALRDIDSDMVDVLMKSMKVDAKAVKAVKAK